MTSRAVALPIPLITVPAPERCAATEPVSSIYANAPREKSFGALSFLLLILAGCSAQPTCPDYAPERRTYVVVIAPQDIAAACGGDEGLAKVQGCTRIVGGEAVIVLPRGVPAWVVAHEAKHAMCGAWHAGM